MSHWHAWLAKRSDKDPRLTTPLTIPVNPPKTSTASQTETPSGDLIPAQGQDVRSLASVFRTFATQGTASPKNLSLLLFIAPEPQAKVDLNWSVPEAPVPLTTRPRNEHILILWHTDFSQSNNGEVRRRSGWHFAIWTADSQSLMRSKSWSVATNRVCFALCRRSVWFGPRRPAANCDCENGTPTVQRLYPAPPKHLTVTEGDGQAHDDDAQPPQPGGPREHLALTNSLIRSLTNVSNVITLLPLCFPSVSPL